MQPNGETYEVFNRRSALRPGTLDWKPARPAHGRPLLVAENCLSFLETLTILPPLKGHS